MTLIDKTRKALDTTFADLECGDCYQNVDDHICMKIGYDRAMLWGGDHWVPTCCVELDELIIPLKTTITIERME